jgi:hypothetical protein
MHPKLTGRAALVAFVLLQYGEDKSLLEFANSLGVEDVAFVHLHDKCFKLISHVISLSKTCVNKVALKACAKKHAPDFTKRLLYRAIYHAGTVARVLYAAYPVLGRSVLVNLKVRPK